MASKRIYEAKIWAAGMFAAGIWRGLGVATWNAPSNCPIATAITMPANSISGDVTMPGNDVAGDVTMPANSATTGIGMGCGYQA